MIILYIFLISRFFRDFIPDLQVCTGLSAAILRNNKLFLPHTTASTEITRIWRVFKQTSRPDSITLRLTLMLSACVSFHPLLGLGATLSHVSRLTITHGVLSEGRINGWQESHKPRSIIHRAIYLSNKASCSMRNSCCYIILPSHWHWRC